MTEVWLLQLPLSFGRMLKKANRLHQCLRRPAVVVEAGTEPVVVEAAHIAEVQAEVRH